MASERKVLALVGSPNREGRTFAIVAAALQGAADAGATTELVHLADHRVLACQDCLPWECWQTRACSYRDPGFEFLTKKLLECDALILGTPIYWWDTSGLVRYLILKMFRLFGRSAPLAGVPALGIGVAGGTGNGLASGLRPVYHFFMMMQMRGIEPLPATRFDWEDSLARAVELGTQLAALSAGRLPFGSLEERLLWYDDLPFIGLDRAQERRLLAARAASSGLQSVDGELAASFVRSETFALNGERERSLEETTRALDRAVSLFEA
jgi:multimeric flavodoxin WrbA